MKGYVLIFLITFSCLGQSNEDCNYVYRNDPAEIIPLKTNIIPQICDTLIKIRLAIHILNLPDSSLSFKENEGVYLARLVEADLNYNMGNLEIYDYSPIAKDYINHNAYPTHLHGLNDTLEYRDSTSLFTPIDFSTCSVFYPDSRIRFFVDTIFYHYNNSADDTRYCI